VINLSGLPTATAHVQKSEDDELLKNVRNNSIGLMSAPPDTSNMGLRHTHRGVEPYDISKADPNIGVFDSAMAGLHSNSGYEARNHPVKSLHVRKSADTTVKKDEGKEYIDLTRLW